jgi:hypothetical protein
MVRRDLKKYDGSNGEVYRRILISLKAHVNHQRILFLEDFILGGQGLQLPFFNLGGGFISGWRNYERKKLEDAHTIGSRGVLFPFGAFLMFSLKKLKGG